MISSSNNLGLITQTKIDKEQMKLLNNLLNTLFDNPDSLEFRIPVDHKALGLFDYPQIIKNPIDLGTIRRNLKNNKYKFVEEVLNDIQLVWDNCKIYNAEGSWIHKKAEKLEKIMVKILKANFPQLYSKQTSKLNKELIKNEISEIDKKYSTDKYDEVTYEEKYRFCQKIRSVTPVQLGILVKIVQTENMNAFEELENERCHILVDNLKRETFLKLNEQLDEWNNSISKDQIIKKIKLN